MLILSRKNEQQIVIADHITIKVIEIRGDKVRLGVDAPANIAVDRHEVWLSKQADTGNRDAA